MASKKISELDDGGSLQPTDLFLVSRNGTSFRLAGSNVGTSLPDTGVTPGSYTTASITVDSKGRITSAASGTSSSPTITLTGDATGTGTGSIAVTLKPSGVTAGSYTNPSITIDASGRVTAAVSTSAASLPEQTGHAGQYLTTDGSALFWSPASGGGLPEAPQDGKLYARKDGAWALSFSGAYGDLSGKPTIPAKVSDLTNDSGFLTAVPASGVTAGSYTNPTITLDASGRVTAAANGAALTIPDQASHAGQFLTTDGTTLSWAQATTDDDVGSNAFKYWKVEVWNTSPGTPWLGMSSLDLLQDGETFHTASSVTGVDYTSQSANLSAWFDRNDGTSGEARINPTHVSFVFTYSTAATIKRVRLREYPSWAPELPTDLILSCSDDGVNWNELQIFSNIQRGTPDTSPFYLNVTKALQHAPLPLTAGMNGKWLTVANGGPVWSDLPDAGNGEITLTGDVTGTGTGSVATTLKNSGVTAGSYTAANITVDAQGRVTSASNGAVDGGVDPLPDQTGHAGQFLTTNGTIAAWATPAGGVGGAITDIFTKARFWRFTFSNYSGNNGTLGKLKIYDSVTTNVIPATLVAYSSQLNTTEAAASIVDYTNPSSLWSAQSSDTRPYVDIDLGSEFQPGRFEFTARSDSYANQTFKYCDVYTSRDGKVYVPVQSIPLPGLAVSSAIVSAPAAVVSAGGGGGMVPPPVSVFASVQGTAIGASPTIRYGRGVQSIIKQSDGVYRITFAQPFNDLYYAVEGSCRHEQDGGSLVDAHLSIDRRSSPNSGKNLTWVDVVLTYQGAGIYDPKIIEFWMRAYDPRLHM